MTKDRKIVEHNEMLERHGIPGEAADECEDRMAVPPPDDKRNQPTRKSSDAHRDKAK